MTSRIRHTPALAVLLAVLGTGAVHAASPEAEATYKDIQATLGSVPRFFKDFPDYAIAGAWKEMKAVQLNPKSALSAKDKDLIGLAVAAQIPCHYCVYFHTETAKLAGATEADIKHALAAASLARHNSTLIGGVVDRDDAAVDVEKAIAKMQAAPKAGPKQPIKPAPNAKVARQEIERTYGFVPPHLRDLPDDAITGVWNEMKAVNESPSAPLDRKIVNLIGLAVSAQTPCDDCVAFNTAAAKVNGASTREVEEAVALAAIVRHWSTFLNGSQIDEQAFRRDVDRVVADAKKKNANRAVGR